MPKFTIIIPHYDGAVSDEFLRRCFECLRQQTCQDFDVLLFHDGPLSRPLPELPKVGTAVQLLVADKRANDCGHSLRRKGIEIARGDYIVHLNPDNVLYPQALATLVEAMAWPLQPSPSADMFENPKILVFAILMRGRLIGGRGGFWRNKEATERGSILTGIPPYAGFIDCMQLVAHRDIWQAVGGWYDLRPESDGLIYENMIAEQGARYVPAVLGEHW